MRCSRSEALDTLVTYFESLHPAAANKRRCVALLAQRVTALSTRRTPLAERRALVRALLALPRLLWQMRDQHAATTLRCLRALLVFVQRARRDDDDVAGASDGGEQLASLERALVPLVAARRRDTDAVLLGPFVAWPAPAQRLLLDLLFYAVSAAGAEGCLRALCLALAARQTTNDDESQPDAVPAVTIDTLTYALDMLHAARDRITRNVDADAPSLAF